MTKSRQEKAGALAFDEHYKQIYGSRWPILRAALLGEHRYAEINALMLKPYYLDPASLFPPAALNPQAGMRVLDMCAAPGGKSLHLALALKGSGSLVLNELSAPRRTRLRRVLEEHLPEAFRNNITVLGRDASRPGFAGTAEYDRILLDAPCSSERHLLASAEEIKQWGGKRTKHLSHRQMALLCSALEALVPGGEMVYSTCSISPEENQNLMDRLQKKRKERLEFLPVEGDGETCGPGKLVLPDSHAGAGPIFYTRIRRIC